jgi:hypothetical protein
MLAGVFLGESLEEILGPNCDQRDLCRERADWRTGGPARGKDGAAAFVLVVSWWLISRR